MRSAPLTPMAAVGVKASEAKRTSGCQNLGRGRVRVRVRVRNRVRVRLRLRLRLMLP